MASRDSLSNESDEILWSGTVPVVEYDNVAPDEDAPLQSVRKAPPITQAANAGPANKRVQGEQHLEQSGTVTGGARKKVRTLKDFVF